MLKGLKIFTYMYFISRKFNCDSQCTPVCSDAKSLHLCSFSNPYIVFKYVLFKG